MQINGKNCLPVGLGCWAIGGQFIDGGAQAGWGDVDDEVSLAALEAGIEIGATFIDTANIYGAGHSEVLVGKAIAGKREQVIVTTKFGILCDEVKKETTGQIQSKADIFQSVEDSLWRLNTEYIDLLLFHLGQYPIDDSEMVLEALEQLVDQQKIKAFGWSTSDPKRAAIFAKSKNCLAMEYAINVLEDDPQMRNFCKENQLLSICRSPLAMGLLTGKYKEGMEMKNNDLRGKNAPSWMQYYIDGKPNLQLLEKLEQIKGILADGGRTLAQGCIDWVLGFGENHLVIPGFKNEKQVLENVAAATFGGLTVAQMNEIEKLLERETK